MPGLCCWGEASYPIAGLGGAAKAAAKPGSAKPLAGLGGAANPIPGLCGIIVAIIFESSDLDPRATT